MMMMMQQKQVLDLVLTPEQAVFLILRLRGLQEFELQRVRRREQNIALGREILQTLELRLQELAP